MTKCILVCTLVTVDYAKCSYICMNTYTFVFLIWLEFPLITLQI